MGRAGERATERQSDKATGRRTQTERHLVTLSPCHPVTLSRAEDLEREPSNSARHDSRFADDAIIPMLRPPRSRHCFRTGERMGIYTSRHPIARLGLFNRLFLGFVRLYCRLGVEGLEHVPRGGGFILVANHSSHVDTAVIFAALPASMHRRVAAAAAQDYFFDDGLRQCVSRILFNVIPVPRNVVSGKDPLRHVVRAIREGYGVLL